MPIRYYSVKHFGRRVKLRRVKLPAATQFVLIHPRPAIGVEPSLSKRGHSAPPNLPPDGFPAAAKNAAGILKRRPRASVYSPAPSIRPGLRMSGLIRLIDETSLSAACPSN